eukprot:4149339-Amphidinium_carterae.1
MAPASNALCDGGSTYVPIGSSGSDAYPPYLWPSTIPSMKQLPNCLNCVCCSEAAHRQIALGSNCKGASKMVSCRRCWRVYPTKPVSSALKKPVSHAKGRSW